MSEVWILVLALALDLAIGEPPAAAHPVVWMGRLGGWIERRAPWSAAPGRQVLHGALLVATVTLLFALGTWGLMTYLKGVHPVAYVVGGTLLLKTTFAMRRLAIEALKVGRALGREDLAAARAVLRSLVSRDTAQVDSRLAASAAVESVAENLCDSVVAPLLYFALLGVPGAVAYRVVNTLDALVGYHGRYEYLGKVAARLDDLLNLVPARVTALLIVLAAFVTRQGGLRAWWSLLRYGGTTESPNAGRPMSAMAGALGVELQKVGHYRLGEPLQQLTPGKIQEAVAITALVAALWAGILVGVKIGLGYIT